MKQNQQAIYRYREINDIDIDSEIQIYRYKFPAGLSRLLVTFDPGAHGVTGGTTQEGGESLCSLCWSMNMSVPGWGDTGSVDGEAWLFHLGQVIIFKITVFWTIKWGNNQSTSLVGFQGLNEVLYPSKWFINYKAMYTWEDLLNSSHWNWIFVGKISPSPSLPGYHTLPLSAIILHVPG